MSRSRAQAPAGAGPGPNLAVQAPVVAVPASTSSGPRSNRAADRMMRRILGIKGVDVKACQGAHQAFRVSVVISALRCIITYVAIPILVPILSLAGWVAGPVGIALCAVAAVNGVISVRRFWRADHPQRWTYTIFIGVVFVILTILTIADLSRMGVTP